MATIKVRVFDAEMHPTGIEYPVIDSPLERFVPDWKFPIIIRNLPFGIDAPEPGSLPMEEKIGKLVYWPGILGDTHAKEGRLVYVEQTDAAKVMAKFPNFFKYAEDTVRLGRALLVNGRNYGAYHGDINVLVVAPGTVIDGIRYEDGSGTVSPRLVSKQGTAIELGPTANSFSVFQGLDFEAIEKDVAMLSERLRRDIRDGMITKLFHCKSDNFGVDNVIKQRFLDISPQLERHPWFSNSIGDVAARWMSSHAFAPYLSMRCYLAIATDDWTLPVGKHLAYRHPKIAGASLRALTIRKTRTLPSNIVGGGVYTATGFWPSGEAFTMKFAGPIADTGKWDIIVCDKNIKMGVRKAPFESTANASVVVLMRYARSALMGVPVEDFKPMNGDYDGDLINIINAEDIPGIFANARKHEKDSVNFKFVKKSETPWTREDAMRVLLNAMHSSMGSATNANSWWLSMNKKERRALLARMFPVAISLMLKMNPDLNPKDMPEMSLEAVDAILQYHVQYHVDAIKSLNCDTYRVVSSEARIVSILSAATDKIPGYLTHRRAMKARVAYETAFPQFLDDMDPIEREKTKNDSKAKQHFQWRMQIPNSIHGTPVNCFKYNKEPLEWMFEQLLQRRNITMDTRAFSKWVPPLSAEDDTAGKALLDKYREHVIMFERLRVKGIINLSSPEDVQMYRNQWRDICTSFAKREFNGDNMRACLALWRVSHDTGEHLVSGSAFLGFPDEAEAIVRQMSGSLYAHRCVVIGVKGLIPVLPMELTGKCELITLDKHTFVRPLDQISGHKERLFGHIAQMTAQEIREGLSLPDDGDYTFSMTLKPSGTAYYAVFEPI